MYVYIYIYTYTTSLYNYNEHIHISLIIQLVSYNISYTNTMNYIYDILYSLYN